MSNRGFIVLSTNLFNSAALLRELQKELYEIARHAEFADANYFELIQQKSESCLRMIDSVLLVSQIESGQTKLDLAPVGLGSVMYEAAGELRNFSGEMVCLENRSASSVDTNKQLLGGLIYALVGFIRQSSRSQISLRSYETKGKVRLGIFSKDFMITKTDYKKALQLIERSQMPLAQYSESSGAGLIVAGKIAQTLGTSLSAKSIGRFKGFSVELPKSPQLSLLEIGV